MYKIHVWKHNFHPFAGLLIGKWKRAEEMYVGGMSHRLMRYLFRFSSGMTFHAAAPPFFPAYYGLIVHVSTFFLRVLRNPGLSCANITRTICAVGDADWEKEAEEIRIVKPSVPASETMSQIWDSDLHTSRSREKQREIKLKSQIIVAI